MKPTVPTLSREDPLLLSCDRSINFRDRPRSMSKYSILPDSFFHSPSCAFKGWRDNSAVKHTSYLQRIWVQIQALEFTTVSNSCPKTSEDTKRAWHTLSADIHADKNTHRHFEFFFRCLLGKHDFFFRAEVFSLNNSGPEIRKQLEA